MRVKHEWSISFDEMPQDVIYEMIDEAGKQGLQVYSTTSVCITEEKYFDLRGIKEE